MQAAQAHLATKCPSSSPRVTPSLLFKYTLIISSPLPTITLYHHRHTTVTISSISKALAYKSSQYSKKSITYLSTPTLSSSSSSMAEPQAQAQVQRGTENIKGLLAEKGPSKSQVLAVITLFPVGGILLTLAGLTLAGTVTGLVVTTPLFVIFSPVLVPAAITIALAVTGFLASGAFGITGLSSLSWIFNYLRQMGGPVSEQVEQAKRRMQEAAAQAGQKTKETGQIIQRASLQEGGRT